MTRSTRRSKPAITYHDRHRRIFVLDVATGEVVDEDVDMTRSSIYGPMAWWTRDFEDPGRGVLTVVHDSVEQAQELGREQLARFQADRALRESERVKV